MAVGSGLGASVGFSAESTYGTYVAPTKFMEFTKEDLHKNVINVQGGGLAAGRLAQLGSRRTLVGEDGSGTFDMDVPTKTFGFLLAQLMGSTAVPVQQAATIAYLQTHAMQDNVGRFFTTQVGVPDTTGTVRPYTYLGTKINSMEFSCEVDQLLNVTTDVDARQVSEAQSLASPSYATGIANWGFNQMTLKLGTYGAEAAVQSVKKCTLKIERSTANQRKYAGNAGLKAEPIMNDYLKVSGTFEADYVDKTIFADRWAQNLSTAMILEWVSPINIASTYYYTIRFQVPMIFFDGETPKVEGPDVVGGPFQFSAQSDGTNPIVTATYLSTDVTL